MFVRKTDEMCPNVRATPHNSRLTAYRHLELCGIAQELYFAAQTIADTAELYWNKPDTAGAEAEYHLFVDDERMAVMNPLDAGRFAAGAFLLRQALR